MKLEKMTNQELAARAQALFEKLEAAMSEAKTRTCNMAEKAQGVGAVHASVCRSYGYLMLAKADALSAAMAMPDDTIQPRFGGK